MNEEKKVDLKMKLNGFFQIILPFLRNDQYYTAKISKQYNKLQQLIVRDTNWLAVTSYHLGKTHGLPFHEQAIKYFEYKNMVIQRRAQYVIIFLTFTLLIMTGLQIYLTFFRY